MRPSSEKGVTTTVRRHSWGKRKENRVPDNIPPETNSPEVLNTQQIVDLFACDSVEFNPSQLQGLVEMLVSFAQKKN